MGEQGGEGVEEQRGERVREQGSKGEGHGGEETRG